MRAVRDLIRQAFRDPVFLGVLVLKLLAAATLGGVFLRRDFIPFITYFLQSGFADPWAHFLGLGLPKAFPYAPGMLWVFTLPRLALAPLMPPGADLFAITGWHLLAMRLPLLLADLAIYGVLLSWSGAQQHRKVLWLYWCSPIVFYVTYYHGQLDLIPTALLLASLAWTFKRRWALSAAALGLGLATKSHLWMAVPFLLVYWARSRIGWRRVIGCAALAMGVYALFVAPYAGSAAYRQMVLGAEEQRWTLTVTLLRLSEQLAVLACPAVLFLLFMKFVSYAKVNRDILLFFLGITYATFVILVPPMPGWFLWSLPFIAYYFVTQRGQSVAPYWVFSACYLAFFLYQRETDLFQAWAPVSPTAAAWPAPQAALEARWPAARHLINVLFTLLEASLFVISYWLYRTGVKRNEQYKLRLRPILIGIGGDSGSGKDFCRQLLERVLGRDQVVGLNGDDHHKWPRGHESWNVFTHLDPAGNDLRSQHRHAVALRDGRAVVRTTYDHATGTFTDPAMMDPNQYIVLSGLHPFYQQQLRNLFDLKIFLDPEDSLRTAWKVQRDVKARGYTVAAVLQSMQARRADGERHIAPQREHADLVVQFTPLRPVSPEDDPATVPVALRCVLRNGANLAELLRALQGVPTLQVASQLDPAAGEQTVTVQGTVSAAQVQDVAGQVIPNLSELAADQAEWADGLPGVLQVVFLALVSDVLQRLPG